MLDHPSRTAQGTFAFWRTSSQSIAEGFNSSPPRGQPTTTWKSRCPRRVATSCAVVAKTDGHRIPYLSCKPTRSQNCSRTGRIARLLPHRSSVCLSTVPPFRRHSGTHLCWISWRVTRRTRPNVSADGHEPARIRPTVGRVGSMLVYGLADPHGQASKQACLWVPCQLLHFGTTLVDRSTSSSNGGKV